MSKNNLIRKSDKKFIRTEKARIRSQFLDVKKQEELIDNLYKRFLPGQKTETVKEVTPEKEVEIKKEAPKTAKVKAKKAKTNVKK